MRVSIGKWGNSYAIRLPKRILDDLDWQEDSELQLEREDDELILKRPDKEERLSRMLEKVKPQEEIDWGGAVGKEAW